MASLRHSEGVNIKLKPVVLKRYKATIPRERPLTLRVLTGGSLEEEISTDEEKYRRTL